MTNLSQRSIAHPDSVWAQVASALRIELGEGPYNSYIARCVLRTEPSGQVCLVTPTAYARDWVRRNALRRVIELWLTIDPATRDLGLKALAEVDGDVEAPAAPVIRAAETPAAPKPSVGAGLQDRMTFDAFVVGKSNSFAASVARQVAAFADMSSTVFFYGAYGSGKTHLLSALAHEARQTRPGAKVIYLTAERFLSTFLKALADKTVATFKEELRGADLLLIDDVHFIGGKASSQEELLHTLATLIDSGRRVVLTADRPPAGLTEIDARLRSYLGSGVACGLEAPDPELRIAIVAAKFDSLTHRGAAAGRPREDVIRCLATHVSGSVRELEGAVNTVSAAVGGQLASITVEEAQHLISPGLKGGPERRITVDEIQKLSADYFGLKQTDLLSERRARAVARPRQVAMWLCKQFTTRSYPDIGRRFGGRDHTTVLHAVKKISELVGSDPQIARDVEALSRKLRG